MGGGGGVGGGVGEIGAVAIGAGSREDLIFKSLWQCEQTVASL